MMDKYGFVQAAFFINCDGIQVLEKYVLYNKLDVSPFLESKLTLNLYLQIERERKKKSTY